jgi:Flp pilus assembly protein CpaB
MRRGRIFIFLALILILILVAVFLFTSGLLFPQSPGEAVVEATPIPPEPMVEVVIVTQRVNRGQRLDESVLGLVPYRQADFREDMYTNISQPIGQRAKVDLEPGFILSRNMLTDSAADLSSTGSDAALLIPPGKVAVSVPIDRISSVSYAPQRGDHVNVIVTLLFLEVDQEFQSRLPNLSAQVLGPRVTEEESSLAAQTVGGEGSPPIGRGVVDPVLDQTFYALPSESQRPRLVSQTLLQDVVVLQVGEFPRVDTTAVTTTTAPVDPTVPEAQPAAAPAQGETTTTTLPVPTEITLIVSPQDAITLNYLLFNHGARLTFALRGADDSSIVQTEAVTLQFLLDQYNIPIPVKLPYAIEPRVDTLPGPSYQSLPQVAPEPAE